MVHLPSDVFVDEWATQLDGYSQVPDLTDLGRVDALLFVGRPATGSGFFQPVMDGFSSSHAPRLPTCF